MAWTVSTRALQTHGATPTLRDGLRQLSIEGKGPVMTTDTPLMVRIACSFATLLLTACAGDGGTSLSLAPSAPTVTPYIAASVFAPAGHAVSGLGDGRVRVTATGSAATSVERVEKIAMARAAEYGAEQNHKFFKATAPQVSTRCGKTHAMSKGEKRKIQPRGYVVAIVDVSYARDATDAEFRPTRATADQLKAELAADPALTAPAAINPEIASQCGL